MDILKIMLIAVTAAMICTYLKSFGSQFHIYVAAAAGTVLAAVVVIKLSGIAQSVFQYADKLSVGGEYVQILFKVAAVTYATSFTSDVCRDSGYGSLANQIELFGRISIIIISVPIIFELLDMTVVQTLGANDEKSIDYESDNTVVSDDYESISEILKESGISGVSFKDLVNGLTEGDLSLSSVLKDAVSERFVKFNTYRNIFVNIILLAVLSGLVKVLCVQGNMDSYDAAHLIILISLITVLAKIYQDSLTVCAETVSEAVAVYEAVMPVFMSAVAVITGSITYAAYYQVILIGITVVNIIFQNVLLNLIKADYYILITGNISRSVKFDKLGELMENIIKWTCRLTIIVFTGVGCVKGIMAPMSDTFKKRIFYKSAKIIPGIGDSLEAVSSALYGSGVILKNAVGLGGVVAVMMIVAAPLLNITVNCLLLKVTAAVLSPVADASLVRIIDGVAGIMGYMMLIVSVTGLLFIIMTAIICAATNYVI